MKCGALMLGLALVIGGQSDVLAALEKGTIAAGREGDRGRVESGPQPRSGSITALDQAGRKVQIDGQWHLIAGARILRQGRPIGIEALKVGERVVVSLARDAAGRLSVTAVQVR